MSILGIDPNNNNCHEQAIRLAIIADPIKWYLGRFKTFSPMTSNPYEIYGDMSRKEVRIFKDLFNSHSVFRQRISEFMSMWMNNYDLAERCWRDVNGLL